MVHDTLQQCLVISECLIFTRDDVASKVPLRIVEPKHLFSIRISYFFFAKFRPIRNPSVCFDIDKFVHTSECWRVL